jgi:hypothetical protein
MTARPSRLPPSKAIAAEVTTLSRRERRCHCEPTLLRSGHAWSRKATHRAKGSGCTRAQLRLKTFGTSKSANATPAKSLDFAVLCRVALLICAGCPFGSSWSGASLFLSPCLRPSDSRAGLPRAGSERGGRVRCPTLDGRQLDATWPSSGSHGGAVHSGRAAASS